jgi:hypothetical protein
MLKTLRIFFAVSTIFYACTSIVVTLFSEEKPEFYFMALLMSMIGLTITYLNDPQVK